MEESDIGPLSTSITVHLDVHTMNDTGHANLSCPPPHHNCSHLLPPMPVLTATDIVQASVLFAMAALSFLGNSLTLYSVWLKLRKHRSTVNTLLAQLAITDLLVTVFCMVGEACWKLTVQWRAGDAACRALKLLQMLSLYSSTYVLVVISLDRFLAIIFPMSKYKAPRRVWRMVGTVWILSALFSVPQAIVFRVLRGPFEEDFYQCTTVGFYDAEWQELLYTIFTLVAMFIVPLLIISAAYLCIFIKIARKTRSQQVCKTKEDDTTRPPPPRSPSRNLCIGNALANMNGNSSSSGATYYPPGVDRGTTPETHALTGAGGSQQAPCHRQNLYRKARSTSLRMTVVIVLAFLLCWTPYYFSMFAHIFQWRGVAMNRLGDYIFFFGMANSLVDPLIYGAFHLCRAGNWLRCCCGGGSPPSAAADAPSLTSTYMPTPTLYHPSQLKPQLKAPYAPLKMSPQRNGAMLNYYKLTNGYHGAVSKGDMV